MNTIVYFEIQSTDVPRSVNFYKNVFDWKFVKQEFLHIEYYSIETEGIAGGLLKRPVETPPTHCGTNAFTCSISVANFDATAALIIKHGGQVAMEKFAIPGRSWMGYFLDTDNNVFGVIEPNENAG